MLLIAQPKSASTSLLDTLKIATGLSGTQQFKEDGRVYRDTCKSSPKFPMFGKYHADAVIHPEERIKRWCTSQEIYKQHVLPVEEHIKAIEGYKVVVLLRDPRLGTSSYQKLNIKDYDKVGPDFSEFYYLWHEASQNNDNILIVDFEDITKNTEKTIDQIINHCGLKAKGSISGIKLSKLRYTHQIFSDYLKGKRIALIGPARTLIGSGMGKEIDNYDIVLRMKQPLVPSKLHEDYGSKTDGIFVNLGRRAYKKPIPEHFEEWRNAGLEWIIMCRRKKKRNINARAGGIEQFFRYERVTSKLYKRCKIACNCKGRLIPFTGTIAIAKILKADFKELYIGGFDFFASGLQGHYDNYNPDKFEKGIDFKKHHDIMWRQNGSKAYRHNARNDVKGVRKMLKGKDNVILEKTLKGILECSK